MSHFFNNLYLRVIVRYMQQCFYLNSFFHRTNLFMGWVILSAGVCRRWLRVLFYTLVWPCDTCSLSGLTVFIHLYYTYFYNVIIINYVTWPVHILFPCLCNVYILESSLFIPITDIYWIERINLFQKVLCFIYLCLLPFD